jgi:hypothetical protein
VSDIPRTSVGKYDKKAIRARHSAGEYLIEIETSITSNPWNSNCRKVIMSSPISPWMNAELLELRDLAAKFFSAELAPHANRFADQHHVDRELWNRAGELGLLCMSIPEEYGGGVEVSRTKRSCLKSRPA